jgi:hypothetical protein
MAIVSHISAPLSFPADGLSKGAATLTSAAGTFPESSAMLDIRPARLSEGAGNDSNQAVAIPQTMATLSASPANVSGDQAAFP